jgi:hypothetical protein
MLEKIEVAQRANTFGAVIELIHFLLMEKLLRSAIYIMENREIEEEITGSEMLVVSGMGPPSSAYWSMQGSRDNLRGTGKLPN